MSLNALIEFIYRAENSQFDTQGYDAVGGWIRAGDRPATPLTQMTVGQVLDWQAGISARGYPSTAAGAVQIMRNTLQSLVNEGHVRLDDRFDAEGQDRITRLLMERRGLSDWQSGRISTEQFGTNLALEWASLPVLQDTRVGGRFVPAGRAAYGGVGINTDRPRASADSFAQVLNGPRFEQIPEGGPLRTPDRSDMQIAGEYRLAGHPSSEPHPGVTVDIQSHTERPHDGLLNILTHSAAQVFGEGTRIVVTSGHEGRASGTRRHPQGFAADFDIVLPDGRVLPYMDPSADNAVRSFLMTAANNGVRGIGYGRNYMGGRFHMDIMPPETYVGTEGHLWSEAATVPGLLTLMQTYDQSGYQGARDFGNLDYTQLSPQQPVAAPVGGSGPGYSPTLGDTRTQPPDWQPHGFDVPPIALPVEIPTQHLPSRPSVTPQGMPRRDVPQVSSTFSQGTGPILGTGAQAFFDPWRSAGLTMAGQRRFDEIQYDYDPSFDPIAYSVDRGLGEHWDYFSSARNLEHWNQMLERMERSRFIRQRMDQNPYTLLGLAGEFTSPDTIASMLVPAGVAVRAGRVGYSAIQSAARGAAWSLAAEVPLEGVRQNMDPFTSQLEGFARVSTATAMGGLLAGGIGYGISRAMRTTLEGRVASEIGEMMQAPRLAQTYDLGGDVQGRVRIADRPFGVEIPRDAQARGVMVRGSDIIVDTAAIARRYREGRMPADTRSASELAVRAIAEAAEEVRLAGGPARPSLTLGGFIADETGALKLMRRPYVAQVVTMENGRYTVDPRKLQEAFDTGARVEVGPTAARSLGERIKPMVIDAAAMRNTDQLEAVLRAGAHLADTAKTNAEFQKAFKAEIARIDRRFAAMENRANRDTARKRREAAFNAGEHAVMRYRQEADRILTDKLVAAVSRLQDSPFKRGLRNALSRQTRDLFNVLAADGAFASALARQGLSLGPSVWQRARVWNGVNAKLARRRGELYERYLGFEKNPSIGSLRLNETFRAKRASGERAISKEEFGQRASRAYISGVKDDIPEVMEFVEEIRGAFAEFRVVAEEYGVLRSAKLLDERLSIQREALDNELYKGDKADPGRVASIEAKIKKLEVERSKVRDEPPDDYFTRVYNRRAILENREFFKERIVKPWMRQRPYGDVWTPGKQDIGARLQEMIRNGAQPARIAEMRKAYDNAPDYGSWERVDFSVEPAAIDARAEELIRTILDEAEPSDLTVLREPTRPTFGRYRQFNIPNAMLLADGPQGNKVADFIETDPLLVMEIYTDRMAPAIEMARTFGRPMDGLSWSIGFDEAIAYARDAEKAAWVHDARAAQKTMYKFMSEMKSRMARPVPPPELQINSQSPLWKTFQHQADHLANHPHLPNVAARLYEVGFDDLEKIAQGTFKAVMKEDGQPYVVRILDPTYIPDRKNASVLAAVHGGRPYYLNHPLVAKPIAAEDIGGLYVEVMPVYKTLKDIPDEMTFRDSIADLQVKLWEDGLDWVDGHALNAGMGPDGVVRVIDGDIKILDLTPGKTKPGSSLVDELLDKYFKENDLRDFMRNWEKAQKNQLAEIEAVQDSFAREAGFGNYAEAVDWRQKAISSDGESKIPEAEIEAYDARHQQMFRQVEGIKNKPSFLALQEQAERYMDRALGEANKYMARYDRFDPPSLDAVTGHLRPNYLKGFNEHWQAIERDLMHLKDRVTNRVIRDPDRWDNRAATVLRNWSQLVMMGGAALPAIQEVGMLIARHGIKRVFREMFLEMDQATKLAREASVEELRAAGGILEVMQGQALARFAETGMDAIQGSNIERWAKVLSNKYFLWNGLAIVADRLKELDAGIRVHDTIARINRVATSASPDEEDLLELARYGIDKHTAARIAREPIYQAPEGHWYANTDAWQDENLRMTFRAAIRQANENTILMATAADKPIIADGTIYLRPNPTVDHYAELMGLQKVSGYWRVQSGLLTLPFSFWNYGFAATNKILTAGLDEPSARLMVGIATMAGLGYLVNSFRTDPYLWQSQPMTQRVGGAIEQSGVLGVLGNYGHLAQTAAIGITGANPFPWQPRNGFEPNIGQAAMEFAGAGPAVARNAIVGPLTGDVDQASWAVPFRNHLLLKDLFDRAVSGIEGLDFAA